MSFSSLFVAWESVNTAVVIGVFVGVIVGWLVILYMQNSERSLLRFFRKSLAVEIYNVRDGEYVRLHGIVQNQEDLLIAPLSGRACVCYRVTVNEYDNRRDSRHVDEFDFNPFVIAAGNDKAYISPKSAGVLNAQLEIDFKNHSQGHNFPSENMKTLLKKHKVRIASGMLSFRQAFRYKEAIVAPGERIAVIGTARWVKDPKTQKRRLEITGTYDKPVLITDHRKALRALPKNL